MKRIHLIYTLALSAFIYSCKKETNGVDLPPVHDVTFEDLQPGELTFKIPDAPFKSGNAQSGIVTANVKKNTDGSFGGFAMSSKNWRSFPWNLSPDFAPAGMTAAQKQACVDSCIFSVYTTKPTLTGNFLVARAVNDDAFITLDKAAVVEHVLVANTSYNYLLETYGSTYSATLDPATQTYLMTAAKVKNINIANPATDRYGRFTLPGTSGNNDMVSLAGQEVIAKRNAGKAAADAARLAGKTPTQVAADSTAAATATSKGFVKLSVVGFNAEKAVGTVDFWLAIRPNVDPTLPAWNIILADWYKVDLTKLGAVDKLVFRLSSSDVDGGGNMRTPPYFCLDGIRIRK